MHNVLIAAGFITDSTTSVSLGVIPRGAYIKRVHLHVTEAFNTGNIKVGTSADDDAFCTATSVTSTGVKSPTLGVGAGWNGTSAEIIAQHDGSPTSGKAHVAVEYFLLREKEV